MYVSIGMNIAGIIRNVPVSRNSVNQEFHPTWSCPINQSIKTFIPHIVNKLQRTQEELMWERGKSKYNTYNTLSPFINYSSTPHSIRTWSQWPTNKPTHSDIEAWFPAPFIWLPCIMHWGHSSVT